jgi:hypothetical protein
MLMILKTFKIWLFSFIRRNLHEFAIHLQGNNLIFKYIFGSGKFTDKTKILTDPISTCIFQF